MKLLRLITFYFVILCAINIYALTNNLMDLLYVDHIECQFNKDLCEQTICKSKFYNRTAKLATVSCLALVPFETIKIVSSLHYHFTGGYRQFAINIKTDWCKYVNGTDKSVLLDVFFKYIKGHTNLDKHCPYTGNLSVHDLPMTAQLFGGQFLPAGDYYYLTIANINGAFGMSWKAYFNIPHGQTILDDAMGK